jgi:hypothetical protein
LRLWRVCQDITYAVFNNALIDFGAFRGTTEQATEEGQVLYETHEKQTSGPKGRMDSMPHMPGLKPRPTARASFPAA